MKAKNN